MDRSGFVYLLSSNIGLFKIGQTSNLEVRISSLAKVPIGIKLLHAIATDDRHWLERYFHRLFERKGTNILGSPMYRSDKGR